MYLAKELHADGFSRLVAVKLLKAQWVDSTEVTSRIRDEARLLGLLRHRNIVDVMDLTSLDGRAAVVMEYLEAVDLRTVINHLAESGEPMPVRAALEIAAACASALDAAYNRPPIPGDKPLRVIHRDIKPSNIMVDEHATVKVLDFGVARSEIEGRESHTQELQFGSVDYMAPERLFFEPETPASDVYSLASTLYELLALDKFGKARGSPERHANWATERFSYLRGLRGLRGLAAQELEALLQVSLDFEHERRPTAAEFYQRSRALARLIDDEELSAWAERALPALVLEAQDAPREPCPLTDSVLTEDSIVFEAGSASPGIGGAGPKAGLDAQAAVVDELRRGALAELEESGVIVPAPATGAPAGGRGYDIAAAPALREDPQWEELPTQVGLEGANALAPPLARREPEPLLAVGATAVPEESFDAEVDQAGEEELAPATPVAAVPAGGLKPVARPLPVARSLADEIDGPTVVEDPGDLAATAEFMVEEAEEAATARMAPRKVKVEPFPTQDTLERRDRVPDDRPTAVDLDERTRPEVAPLAGARELGAPRPADPAGRSGELGGGSGFDADGYYHEEEEPGGSGAKALLPVAALGGCLLIALGVGGLGAVFGLDIGGLRTMVVEMGSGVASADPAPEGGEATVEVPASGAAEGAGAVEAAAPDGGISFRSAAQGTRKLKVECTGATAKGTDQAAVALEQAERCTVTAILADRARLVAVVEGATEGSHVCFADAQNTCVRD